MVHAVPASRQRRADQYCVQTLAEIGALYRVRTRKDANSPYIMASTKPVSVVV